MKKFTILLLLNILVCNQAWSQGQIFVSGPDAQTTITNNSATAVAPFLTITATENITDFTVSITDSYSINDAIAYPGSLPSGITTSGWNATKRAIVFKGAKTAEEWQTFLRTITIATANVCSPETRKVSFIAGETFYNPLNGHYYKVTTTASNWLPTKIAAASDSYYGSQGYLATMTSQAENTFVSRLIGQNSWMGASDDYQQINEAVGYTLYSNQSNSEGKWYWVTGPEKGTLIQTTNSCGGYVPGVYNNWNGCGEPNNSGAEHCLHMYADGRWNDFANSQTIYGIVEYGDMPGDYAQSTPQFTKEIFIQGSSSGTISGGNVTVCADSNSTTLTLSGFTGSVVRWESSVDNFITAGSSISNTSTTITVNNISTTMYYRAVVNSTAPTTCNGLVTSSAPVYVSSAVSGNVFAVNTSICTGSDVDLYLSGQVGEVQKWQRSTNNSTWTDISNTHPTLIETVNIVGTMYYRVFVQVPGCGSAVISPAKSITIVTGTPPQGGSVSSNTHFSATNSGTLTLTGYTGTISKWQRSTDDGLVWINISNTSNTHNYNNISTETLFRVLVANGSCGASYSTSGKVEIIYTPTIIDFEPKTAAQGNEVVITGTNMENVAQVQFGGANAASFTINSTSRITAVVPSGATSGSISVTNSGGSESMPGFTFNAAPTDISLSVNTIFENNPLNELIGEFSVTDSDVSDTHTYQLVSGMGDSDNSVFLFSGADLQANSVFDFETKNEYAIRVEVQDNYGNTYQKALTISVTDVNEAPTDIVLDNTTVPENSAVGSIVGSLSTTDVDMGNTYTYTLVTGNGTNDADNGNFSIDGTDLKLGISPDYELQESYAIYMNVNDGANDYKKTFIINVSDINEDLDGDGVANNMDNCPDTLTGDTVDFNGCSDAQKDTDTDGVNDALDQCPNTPFGETVDANGCSNTQKDSDDDGINDALDNCVILFNTDQADIDNDGLGDVCDEDMDGDGVVNYDDAFPSDPSENVDSDGDGIGNNEDTDDDNDGLPDVEDSDPLNPVTDMDGDGIIDTIDNCPIAPNPDQLDTDLDGKGNTCDLDDDNDGVLDTEDAFPEDSAETIDTDGDGLGDNTDVDDDNDGTLDLDDAFPIDANENLDTDGDGIGNNEDTDNDGDGVLDELDQFPLDSSEDMDADKDGIGDNFDDDDDNDGILDRADAFPTESVPSIAPAEAFTPNGDGNNDKWIIPGIDNYPNNVVQVFNRWGHLVYTANGYTNDWEGSYKSRSEKLPTGSYLYIINLGNGSASLKGWIFINY